MTVINFLVQNGDAHLKNFGLVYDDIDNINLAPAYDVVSTTVYIKNDIPALHLLGAKKWWKEKHLLKFGIEFCDLGKSDAKSFYDECVEAKDIILEELSERFDDIDMLLDTLSKEI